VTSLGTVEMFAIALGLPLALALLTFWIWMLVDCLKHESKEGNDRLVWALVIVFTELLGAILYYFMRYKRRQPADASAGAG
jgi:hypothetical protein